MKLLQTVSVALIALFLIALPALALSAPVADQHAIAVKAPAVPSRHGMLWNAIASISLLIPGVVVVTYAFPTAGTTAPTAIAASQVPTQTAQVFFADTDTQAVVTHNWGLPASFPGFLFPEVIITKSLGGASDSSFATNFTFGLTNTNSVTINKIGNGTGSGGTYNVVLRRPHSMGL